jgi:hypothetical protein
MLLLLPLSAYLQTEGGVLRKKKDSTKRTMKMTKSTCAIQAAVPAIPAKPKKPAMMAMTKKMSAYDNIANLSFLPGFGVVLFPGCAKNSSLFDMRTDVSIR